MSPGATVRLIDEFLIVFGQQSSSMTWRKTLYQTLDTLSTLYSLFMFSWDLLTIKNIEYCQP